MTPEIAPGIQKLSPIQACKLVTASSFGITFEQICQKTRKRETLRIRQAMQVCLHRYTELSASDIAALTQQDHSTIFHSLIKVKNAEFMRGRYGTPDELLNTYKRFEHEFIEMLNIKYRVR